MIDPEEIARLIPEGWEDLGIEDPKIGPNIRVYHKTVILPMFFVVLGFIKEDEYDALRHPEEFTDESNANDELARRLEQEPDGHWVAVLNRQGTIENENMKYYNVKVIGKEFEPFVGNGPQYRVWLRYSADVDLDEFCKCHNYDKKDLKSAIRSGNLKIEAIR